MSRVVFDLKETSNLLNALSYYYNSICNSYYRITKDPDFVSKQINSFQWEDIDIHIIQQVWGSTAGGWQGIGGAAITTYNTVIIENNSLRRVFVFYHGELAYICKLDELYLRYKTSNKLHNLPGIANLNSLTVVYYNNK